MKDLISVIVPVYNTAELLPKCIDSILTQTYSNLEVILVNDGSSDNSGNICDEYAKKDSRIKVIHKENGGVSEARNVALDTVNGDYVIFVDSDDYLEPTIYETLINLSYEHNCDISICSYTTYREDGSTFFFMNSDEIEIMDKAKAVSDLLEDERLQSHMWNKLYKAKLFNDIRFPTASIMEDVCVNYMLFEKANKVVFYHKPLYNYIRRTGSLSLAPSGTKNKDAFTVILNRYLALEKTMPEIQKCNDYSLVMWMIRTYTFTVRANDTNDGYFKEYLDLFKTVFDRQSEYIAKKLSADRLMMAYAMMWDYEKGKDVVKLYYGL